eukprot:jgi/Botrbrau1/3701/Bobra.0008s0028.3
MAEAVTASAAQSSLNHVTSSRRGSSAVFGTAEEEVARILRVQHHYYAVLKVAKTTEQSEIRGNYLRLSRLVHPDKCRHPQAPDASAVVNQAYDTLRTAVKKALYDRYVDDTEEAQQGMTYAEWEAQNAANLQLPEWMQRILRVPGGALCLLLILFPVTLVLLLVFLLMVVFCFPVRLIAYCCCGYGRADPSTAAETENEGAAPPYIPPLDPLASPDTQSAAGISQGNGARNCAAGTYTEVQRCVPAEAPPQRGEPVVPFNTSAGEDHSAIPQSGVDPCPGILPGLEGERCHVSSASTSEQVHRLQEREGQAIKQQPTSGEHRISIHVPPCSSLGSGAVDDVD